MTFRDCNGPGRASKPATGFSMIELLVVLGIIMVVAAMAVPNIMQAIYNMRLRGAAGDLSGLMQQARIMAAKNNATYVVRYGTLNGANIAYVDVNNNSSFNAGEPLVSFPQSVTMAAGAPGGSPAAYVLVGDTAGTVYTNSSLIAFTPRGLPCWYNTGTTPATCAAPPAGYFIHYMNDARPYGMGWAGVVIARGGRTKAVIWTGSSWN